MRTILKLLSMLIAILFPARISKAMLFRCKKTRSMMLATPALRLFWRVILSVSYTHLYAQQNWRPYAPDNRPIARLQKLAGLCNGSRWMN